MTTINTADDLLSLLRENQEFREAVRKAILTENCLHFQRYSVLSHQRFVAKSKRCAGKSNVSIRRYAVNSQRYVATSQRCMATSSVSRVSKMVIRMT